LAGDYASLAYKKALKARVDRDYEDGF